MLDLVQLPVPDTIDGPGGFDFVAGIGIRNIVEADAFGTPDLQCEPAEQLPYYQDPARPQRMILARRDGRWVGRARYELEPTATTAWVNVEVLPAHRGRGVGKALADEVECILVAEGRPKAIAYVPISPQPGPQLPAPTGAGSVPRHSRDVRFLLARGYQLEQVERVSQLVLPIPELAARLSEAGRRAGEAYRTHSWIGPTPSRWIADMAHLRTRLSTDVPTAGLEEPSVECTAEQILAADTDLNRSPRRRLTTVVEHRPSASLVAFTELALPPRPGRAAVQEATLVSHGHRGNGLGLLVKLASLDTLAAAANHIPSVTTFNAEENTAMLAVNTALGYRPIAYQSGWRKDLPSQRQQR